jgi:hypothetical protein
MGARLYNTITGRFLQVDPIPGGSAGPYLYPTNPVTVFDLDGNKWSFDGIRNWVKRNKRSIAQFGVSAAVAATAAAFAAAVCVGTVGFGCVVGAAAAYGMVVGLPASLMVDKGFRHRTSGRQAAGYLLGSAAGAGRNATVFRIYGKTPLNLAMYVARNPRRGVRHVVDEYRARQWRNVPL